MPDSPPWGRARSLTALVLVPVLLFGPIVAAGQVFLPFLPVVGEPLASENPTAAAEARAEIHAPMGDRVYPFLVDQWAARGELMQGHLPLWEPLQSLGMPLFGGNVAALGYPPNWLAFLVPPERAAAPLAALSLFLAGLGTFLFLTRLALDRRAALLGALGVQLGTFGLANLHYYMKVDAALWLPWALWAIEGLARRRRFARLALALALTLSFLGGMVSISVFVLGASALYALVRLGPWARSERAPAQGAIPAAPEGSPSRAARWRPLVGALACLALGTAAASFWTLPVAEAAGASLRTSQTVAGSVASSLPPASSLGLLVPDLAGPPEDPTPSDCLPVAWWLTPASQSARAENASVLEWNVHAGIALFLLALVALVADPRRAAFPGLLLLGVLAFSQGWPLVRALYALPGLALGAPQRVLALAWILWPWLAALGLAALLARAPRALPTLLAGSLVLALALLQAWGGLDPESWARALAAAILERYPGTDAAMVEARLPLAGRIAAGEHLRDSLARAGSAALALFTAAGAALLLERRAPRFDRGPATPVLLAGLVLPIAVALGPFLLVDGFAARGPQALLALSGVVALAALAGRAERGDLPLWLPFAALLLVEGFLGSFRHVQGRSILTDGLFPPSSTLAAVREAAGDGRVLRYDPTPDLAHSQALARPNMLIPYGIADLTPYPTFTPRQAAELAARIDPRMLRRNHVAPLPDTALLGHPLLDLLRAQCVLSLEPLAHPRLAPVLERPGFCIYRRTGALAGARIVPEARAGASDEAVLAALAAPDVDFARGTWIAPEHAAGIVPFEPGPDWRPGTLDALEHPAKNRVRVRVRDARGGWLVVHEQWARGWRATLDGSPVPLLRADHYARAVRLPDEPRAELVLELEYSPPSFRWGAAVTLLSLAALLAWELLNRHE